MAAVVNVTVIGSVGRINVLGLQTKLTILPVGGDKF